MQKETKSSRLAIIIAARTAANLGKVDEARKLFAMVDIDYIPAVH